MRGQIKRYLKKTVLGRAGDSASVEIKKGERKDHWMRVEGLSASSKEEGKENGQIVEHLPGPIQDKYEILGERGWKELAGGTRGRGVRRNRDGHLNQHTTARSCSILRRLHEGSGDKVQPREYSDWLFQPKGRSTIVGTYGPHRWTEFL